MQTLRISRNKLTRPSAINRSPNFTLLFRALLANRDDRKRIARVPRYDLNPRHMFATRAFFSKSVASRDQLYDAQTSIARRRLALVRRFDSTRIRGRSRQSPSRCIRAILVNGRQPARPGLSSLLSRPVNEIKRIWSRASHRVVVVVAVATAAARSLARTLALSLVRSPRFSLVPTFRSLDRSSTRPSACSRWLARSPARRPLAQRTRGRNRPSIGIGQL